MIWGSGQELVHYENSIYKHILPTPGKVQLEELTPAILQKFYAELKSTGRLRETERFGPGRRIAPFGPAMR